MREHQQAVFRLAYLRLGDAGEAEDMAQEAFLRAFRALDRFDPGRPLRPWLLAITANLIRNRQRTLVRARATLERWLRGGGVDEAHEAARAATAAVEETAAVAGMGRRSPNSPPADGPPHPPGSRPPAAIAPDRAVEALAMQAATADTLWQAIRRLDAHDQEVLYFRFFLDMSEAETADALAVAQGTVKSRTHRALGRLRAVVEREFPALGREREA